MTSDRYGMRLRLGLYVACLCTSQAVLAGDTEYFLRNESFCSVDNSLCIKGTLSYTHGTRTMKLHGRVKAASGPGLLRIWFNGNDNYGRGRSTDLEVAVRGRRGEIVDQELQTNAPEVERWNVISIHFQPGVDKTAR